MLRLGRGLRRLGSGRGAGDSGRLPLSAEMPKKAGATSKGKSQTKEPETPLPPLGPVAVDPKGCVTVAIHAKPGSKQNAVTDLTPEAVSVAIAAPPSEGEANAELCRYLSKVLKLRKSDVVLEKGGKSREKVVKLLASTTPEEILEKLKQQVEKK
ncbi:UPF0235 protein C15orf40 homolog [Felis catus]|uniref:UPF0235 protein C15orf40 homolog n=1 Tax=Felis catus TaxID=9685 RepID=UPI000C2FE23F|nr:UPF0235 protein C15orf40 homolog [Felis catus]